MTSLRANDSSLLADCFSIGPSMRSGIIWLLVFVFIFEAPLNVQAQPSTTACAQSKSFTVPAGLTAGGTLRLIVPAVGNPEILFALLGAKMTFFLGLRNRPGDARNILGNRCLFLLCA